MNAPVSDDLSTARHGAGGAIRRRHVIYVEGYDPRGAKGYFDLLRRTCARFEQLWPAAAALQQLESDSEDFAHWLMEVRGADWRVATHYDFLRLERFIRSDLARPKLAQALRGLGWCVGDVLSGAQFRIFRASWRFALHLLYFQLLLVAWLALPAAFGLIVGRAVAGYFASPPAGAAAALAAAAMAFYALSAVAERRRVIQISSCWTTLRKFARGRPTWLDQAIDVGARRVLAVARANAVDELVVVGHSTGGVIAATIIARALELDPDLGRRGPPLVLLTLGSVMPAVALHPAARRMRAVVGLIACAPPLAWIDCQSRKDVMCFANFDPVEGIGVRVGARRCNPLVWQISFREMISPQDYGRFRWNYFRVHYQYIMAGDRPSPYDYVLLVGGPSAITAWPERHRELMAAFLEESTSGRERSRPELVAGASP